MEMSSFLIYWEKKIKISAIFSSTSLRFSINFADEGRNFKKKLKMCVDISGIYSEIIE